MRGLNSHKIEYKGKLEFEGEYLNGKRNGKGKEYYMYYDGIVFEGEYLNGKRNGKGKEYHTNGTIIFEGEYLNGERNGKGKEYSYKGNLIFEGEYNKDQNITLPSLQSIENIFIWWY